MKSLSNFIKESLTSNTPPNKIIEIVKKHFKEHFLFGSVKEKSGKNPLIAVFFKFTNNEIDKYKNLYEFQKAYGFLKLREILSKYNYDVAWYTSMLPNTPANDDPEYFTKDSFKDNLFDYWNDDNDNEIDILNNVIKSNINPGIELLNKDYNEYMNQALKAKDNKVISVYYLEPIYGEDVTEFIQKECNGKLYHFTRRKSYDKMMNSNNPMLRCKECDCDLTGFDRYNHSYTKRSYFIYSTPENLAKDIKEIKKEIGARFKDTMLLEVDVSDLNIHFYKDTFSNFDCCCYCFNNIPVKFIKEIDIKSLTSKKSKT